MRRRLQCCWLFAALISSVSACTLARSPQTPSKYDTRKLRRDYVIAPDRDPQRYLAALLALAKRAGCSGFVAEGVTILECGEEVHLQLTPGEKTISVACFASSIERCRKELARIAASGRPRSSPASAAP